jgi:hypothetical protein
MSMVTLLVTALTDTDLGEAAAGVAVAVVTVGAVAGAPKGVGTAVAGAGADLAAEAQRGVGTAVIRAGASADRQAEIDPGEAEAIGAAVAVEIAAALHLLRGTEALLLPSLLQRITVREPRALGLILKRMPTARDLPAAARSQAQHKPSHSHPSSKHSIINTTTSYFHLDQIILHLDRGTLKANRHPHPQLAGFDVAVSARG